MLVENTKDDDLRSRTPKFNNSESTNRWKYTVAFAFLLVLIVSYLAFEYWSKWRRSENEVQKVTAQLQQLTLDNDLLSDSIEAMQRDLKIMADPAFTRVVMEGTANSPEAMASLYWNPASQEVYLNVQNLKALPAESQYQLWAIIDDQPVDAGVFDGGVKNGLVQMKSIGMGATVFTVTVEDRGGSETPSLEAMQVAGNIAKG